jgi:hypothetical protein
MVTENLNEINNVGDVVTEKILLTTNGKTVDIREFVLSCSIFEDVFSNVMTAALAIRDAGNLINEYQLSGLETITLAFKTPGFDRSNTIEKKFYLNAIKNRRLGEKEQVYEIDLISVEAANDNVTKISKKYSGKTDEVIFSIFNDYIKDDKNLLNLENHNSNVTLVSPFWSPFKIINWICNRSYQNAQNVVFYESNKNFYLTSIENLTQQNSFGTYVYSSISNLNDTPLSLKYFIINGITDFRYFDIFRANDFGYYTSKLITHDITLKQYKEFQHDHYEFHNRVKHLEDKHTFPSNIIKNSDSFRTVKTKQYNMFNETPDPLYETWAMQRNSLMYEANNLKFIIKVPGRTDIEAGRVVDLIIPRSIAADVSIENNEKLIDPYLSGRYLVTAIRHDFALNRHDMYLEVMKDSFQQSIE